MNATANSPARISASAAIQATRRWLMVARSSTILFYGLVPVVVVAGSHFGLGILPLLILTGVWFMLGMVSSRSMRYTMEATRSMAAGDFESAEVSLGQAVRAFTVVRTGKVASLQNLAALRHAKREFADAARLAAEVLARRSRGESHLDLPTRLLLIDSLVELGDFRAAEIELGRLPPADLTLRETVTRTLLNTEVLAATGRFEAILADAKPSVELFELLPGSMAARGFATIALAAKRLGVDDLREHLVKRATLIADAEAIVRRRPALAELFV